MILIKNFIAGVAVLMLLIIFPLQNVLDVVNDKKINEFDLIVYRATQTARTDGYFTPENIAELKANIVSSFSDVRENEIYLNFPNNDRVKYRLNVFDEREVIEYEIGIPIKRIVFAAGMFGIDESRNSYLYVKKGYVLSEVVAP